MEIKNIFWDEIDALVGALVRQVFMSGKKFDWVYGVPRAGLIPAVIVSHNLKIPYLENPDSVRSGDKVLIVDEICDSGATLSKIARKNLHYEKHNDVSYSYGVLFKRHSATFHPDFVVDDVNDNAYIKFPWEADIFSIPKSWNGKNILEEPKNAVY